MTYSIEASRQGRERLKPIVFSLRPEAQWTLETPEHVWRADVTSLLRWLSDIVISRGLEERWVYDVGSSMAALEFTILENFDLLIRTTKVPETHGKSIVPDWIRTWAQEFDKDGLRLKEALEEARRISRKFKTPLSEEVIREREGRR